MNPPYFRQNVERYVFTCTFLFFKHLTTLVFVRNTNALQNVFCLCSGCSGFSIFNQFYNSIHCLRLSKYNTVSNTDDGNFMTVVRIKWLLQQSLSVNSGRNIGKRWLLAALVQVLVKSKRTLLWIRCQQLPFPLQRLRKTCKVYSQSIKRCSFRMKRIPFLSPNPPAPIFCSYGSYSTACKSQ